MTYMPKRGNDDLWAKVKDGDIQAVEAFSAKNKLAMFQRGMTEKLLNQSEEEVWFDAKFSKGRRRRGSVIQVVSEQMKKGEQPGVEELIKLSKARIGKGKLLKKVTSEKIPTSEKRFGQIRSLQTTAKLLGARKLVKNEDDKLRKRRNKNVVGALFDSIFVKPVASREVVIKYGKHNKLLPLLRSMSKAHIRGETNVATHVRNSTTLTRAYPKLRSIDPNDLLESYANRRKIIGIAESYIEDVHVMKNYTEEAAKSKRTSESISQALINLENRTHSLAGSERYQCFHSKFKASQSLMPQRQRKRKTKRKKGRRKIKKKVSRTKSVGKVSPRSEEVTHVVSNKVSEQENKALAFGENNHSFFNVLRNGGSASRDTEFVQNTPETKQLT